MALFIVSSRFTLKQKERLKSRKAIEVLFREGKRLTRGPVRVLYRSSETAGLRLGVTVSSRLFPHAAGRNRVKRLLRECWRLQKNPLREQLQNKGTGLDVFLLYTDKKLPDYKSLYPLTGQIISFLNESANG